MAAPGNPKAPDEANLREAALRHLARYASSEANLLRVLQRRIDRWARAVGEDAAEATQAARHAAREVVCKLTAAGVVSDVDFAAMRARSLARAGRSRRAVAAHLAAKGVAAEAVRACVPEDAELELTAALIQARRRRIGPFGPAPADAPARMKQLAALARAGFSQDIARRALAMDRAAAEALLAAARQP